MARTPKNPDAPKVNRKPQVRPDHIFLLLADGVTNEEAKAIRAKIVKGASSPRSFFSAMSDDDGVASFNAVIKVPLAVERRGTGEAAAAGGSNEG